MIVNGKKIAEAIIQNLKLKPKPQKFLAVFWVGKDAATASFVSQKEKRAKELGIDLRLYNFPASITNDKLRQEVGKIALAKRCGGAIVQLPLPPQLNRYYILNAIPREKDIDVLGERALGAFYNDRNRVLPPAVGTLKKILEEVRCDLEDKKIGVVGLGELVGRPISLWLERKAQDLILLRKGSDLTLLRECDLVVTGVGQANLIEVAMLKKGAGVIDFGYDTHNGSLRGDLNPSGAERLSFYTPTPDGTGPILVAQLFENFYALNT